MSIGKPVAAMPPHPLDDVIGNKRDASSIAKAVCNSELMLAAINRGIESGLETEAKATKHENLCSGTFAQSIRVEIQNALCNC